MSIELKDKLVTLESLGAVYNSEVNDRNAAIAAEATARTEAIANEVAARNAAIVEAINQAETGAPTKVELVSQMTDPDKNYLYIGEEQGYNSGHIYYLVDGAPVDKGVFGGTNIDNTLTISGQAADAKVTGDKIEEIKEDLSDISEVINHFDASTVTTGYRLSADGSLYSNSGYFTSDYISVDEGETYTKNSPTADAYHRWATYDSSKTFVRAESSSNSIAIADGESYVRICGAESEISTTIVVCDSSPKTAVDYTAREEINNVSADLQAGFNTLLTEKDNITVLKSGSDYTTYNQYTMTNAGVPQAGGQTTQNIIFVPVTAGEKLRALATGRTLGETRYAYHSAEAFAGCTSDTVISVDRYSEGEFYDYTVPPGAKSLLIEARSLYRIFKVSDIAAATCVNKKADTCVISKDVTLDVNSGSQTVSARTIISAGHNVTAKLLTTEAVIGGSITAYIGRTGSANAFKFQQIIGKGQTVSFYTAEFVTGIAFTVTNVTTAGSATIVIEVEDNEQAEIVENIMYVSPGKNLFDKNKVLVGAFFNPALAYSGGNVISGYIPIANGETMACNYPSGSPNGYFSAVLVKDKYSAEVIKTSYEKTITNDLGYDCYALWMISSGRNLDTVQIEKGEYVSEFQKYNPAGAYVEDNSENTHGKMGALYPDEMKIIDKFIDGAGQTTYKLHFVHISDNHNTPFGDADDFTDNSNASFLVNTGDMVQDTFNDPFTNTSNRINAMEKSCYITLGNHDVYRAPTLQARYDKFFAPIADHNSMTENTKTYYAVDFAAQGVKCIFLDNFDGIDDYSGNSPDMNGIMSQEQIEWLFDQLDDAITHDYHVCIFMHYSITRISQEDSVLNWYDQAGSRADTDNWLPQTIDAFQRRTTVSFTYRNVEYSHTFSGYGTFVAYFVGHQHCDIVGTLDGYPHQLNVAVARPIGGATWEGASRTDYAPYVFNYCTVDTKSRHLSVFRVGQQRTVWGTKRDVFTWRYWTAR